MKRSPSFWWEFEHTHGQINAIIVESDRYSGVLGRFPIPHSAVTAEAQIAQAQALIRDFEAGRKTPNKS